MFLLTDPCICSHLYVQFWMFSLWETLAARKETDMRMCGIMELEVDRIWVPFAILCIVCWSNISVPDSHASWLQFSQYHVLQECKPLLDMNIHLKQ